MILAGDRHNPLPFTDTYRPPAATPTPAPPVTHQAAEEPLTHPQGMTAEQWAHYLETGELTTGDQPA